MSGGSPITIFVRPTASGGGRKRLSSDGGVAPVWAPNGRELFFINADKLSVIDLDSSGNPVGRDRVVMAAPTFEGLLFEPANPEYDIMPDGEHFVFNLGPSPSVATHYDVVINWFNELRNRARR